MDAIVKKPYHLMTPSERIAARIASNKQIEKKVEPVLRMQKAGNNLVNSLEARKLALQLDASLQSYPDGKGGLPNFILKSFDEVVNMNYETFKKEIFSRSKAK